MHLIENGRWIHLALKQNGALALTFLIHLKPISNEWEITVQLKKKNCCGEGGGVDQV